MKAAKLLAAFSIALVSLTACEPSRNTQMYELNGMVFQLSYTNWKWYSANVSRNGRAYYPYMDWFTDECSIVGNGPWDFKYPCRRHDFAYRNLKRISARYSPGVWYGRNKNAADLQFRDDLYARCGDFGWYAEWACRPHAKVYFSAVNILPPYAWPWDVGKQGFVW